MLAALGFGAIAIAAVAAEVASEVVGELIAAVCDDNVFVLCGFALWRDSAMDSGIRQSRLSRRSQDENCRTLFGL